MLKKLLSILSITTFLILSITGCETKKTSTEVPSQPVRESLLPTEEDFLLNRIEELKYIDFYGKNISTNNLTNQEVLQILNYKYKDLNNITFEELESVSLRYLNHYLTPEDVKCDTHSITLAAIENIYNYNSTEKKYELNTNHTGHLEYGITLNVVNHLKESYKEDNTYTIIVYKVFSELLNSPSNNTSNYYRTYIDAVNKKDLLFTESNDIKAKMTSVSSELVPYTYKFVKKGEDFYLKEYIINES